MPITLTRTKSRVLIVSSRPDLLILDQHPSGRVIGGNIRRARRLANAGKLGKARTLMAQTAAELSPNHPAKGNVGRATWAPGINGGRIRQFMTMALLPTLERLGMQDVMVRLQVHHRLPQSWFDKGARDVDAYAASLPKFVGSMFRYSLHRFVFELTGRENYQVKTLPKGQGTIVTFDVAQDRLIALRQKPADKELSEKEATDLLKAFFRREGAGKRGPIHRQPEVFNRLLAFPITGTGRVIGMLHMCTKLDRMHGDFLGELYGANLKFYFEQMPETEPTASGPMV